MRRTLCAALVWLALALQLGAAHEEATDVEEMEKVASDAMKMLNMASNSVNQLVMLRVEEAEIANGKYHITLVTGLSSCSKSDAVVTIEQCPLQVRRLRPCFEVVFTCIL
jgi:hypothetical protein